MSAYYDKPVTNLKAWVVFSGQADRPWLKLLRPGFRHCFVIVNDGAHWVSFDPMLNHIDLRVHDHVPAEFDLPRWLEQRGQIVVEAKIDRSRKNPAPVALFTCVEAVKRVLGLHRFFILTPWQLYRHLLNASEQKGFRYG
ncbi:MAG: hypothetical protein GC149_20550 [Gammaproteobacteria bacterium]|nr:hypothetical protein [Gammaproteobacteria bacterium]